MATLLTSASGRKTRAMSPAPRKPEGTVTADGTTVLPPIEVPTDNTKAVVLPATQVAPAPAGASTTPAPAKQRSPVLKRAGAIILALLAVAGAGAAVHHVQPDFSSIIQRFTATARFWIIAADTFLDGVRQHVLAVAADLHPHVLAAATKAGALGATTYGAVGVAVAVLLVTAVLLKRRCAQRKKEQVQTPSKEKAA